MNEAVEKSGITKSKICSILDITISTFRNWKLNQNPNPKTLERMCNLIGVKKEDVYDKIEIKKEEEIKEKPVIKNDTLTDVTKSVINSEIQTFQAIQETDNLYQRIPYFLIVEKHRRNLSLKNYNRKD